MKYSHAPEIGQGTAVLRLDLLRSPVFLLALAVLVVNDWALKPLLHNALTGKLSDFAGLAAFTLFLCSLWRERRLAISVGVSIAFTLWKSPLADGLIAAANHLLPFHIGRTVDYTDLIALPVVWLSAACARRLPLIPMRAFQLWFIAAFSVLAFTATSMPHRGSEWQMAQFGPSAQPAPAAETGAAIQRVLDALAKAHGMHCSTCQPLAKGRVYNSPYAPNAPSLFLFAYYDSRRSILRYEVSWNIQHGVKQGAALRADLKRELQGQFPSVDIRAADGPVVVEEAEIDAAMVPGYTPQADQENEAIYRAMQPVVARIAAEAGLKKDAADSFSGGRLLDVEGDREWNVYLSPYALAIMIRCYTSSCKARVAPLADKLEHALKQRLGAGKVSRKRLPPPPKPPWPMNGSGPKM